MVRKVVKHKHPAVSDCSSVNSDDSKDDENSDCNKLHCLLFSDPFPVLKIVIGTIVVLKQVLAHTPRPCQSACSSCLSSIEKECCLEGERESDLKREIQAVWFSLSLSSMSPLLKWRLNIVDKFVEVAVASLLRVCDKNVDKLSVYIYMYIYTFYNVVSSFFFKRFFAF